MRIDPIFTWDEDAGIATCVINYKDNVYFGSAACHPDDQDMISRLTGQEIAYRRARIEYLISVRDNELKPGIKALKHLSGTMVHSKKFNPKSYENLSLQRELQNLENDLTAIQEEIIEERVALKRYILTKDEYYKKIRQRRNGPKAIKNLGSKIEYDVDSIFTINCCGDQVIDEGQDTYV